MKRSKRRVPPPPPQPALPPPTTPRPRRFDVQRSGQKPDQHRRRVLLPEPATNWLLDLASTGREAERSAGHAPDVRVDLRDISLDVAKPNASPTPHTAILAPIGRELRPCSRGAFGFALAGVLLLGFLELGHLVKSAVRLMLAPAIEAPHPTAPRGYDVQADGHVTAVSDLLGPRGQPLPVVPRAPVHQAPSTPVHHPDINRPRVDIPQAATQ
jgi:hypothetical protein